MAINFPDSPTNGQIFTSGSTSWIWDGTKWGLNTNVAVSNDSMPVGSILWFANTSTTPPGWLAADGSAVSRTTYATLFASIGTTYGAGDGSTTFNVPSVAATTGKYFIRYTTSLGTVTTTSLSTAPVGTMLDWPTTSSYPTGYLRADGTAVSRTSYADLFALIGTTYGIGDNSTTFNLPNLVAAGSGSPVKIIKASLGGTVEPSTVAHASSHIRGGSDIIDADRAQIDFVPTRYTRDSSASEAGANTDLTAHLKGIDNQLNTQYNSLKRLGYQSRTSTYSITSTTVAGASNIFTNITWTADGTSAYLIEIFSPYVYTGTDLNGGISVAFVDGSGTSLGTCAVFGPVAVSTYRVYDVLSSKFYYTPSAGTATINARAIYSGSNTNGSAIHGNATGHVPSYIAVYGPILL
jgi:microcystin-dependent protein